MTSPNEGTSTTIRLPDADARDLLERAIQVRGHAYARYSGFPVGAALLDDQGNVHVGANVENASFGLTICAERAAVFAAIAAGARKFVAIGIVGPDADQACPPCGACRQVLHEFAPDLVICVAGPSASIEQLTLRDLLPRAFGPSDVITRSCSVPPTGTLLSQERSMVALIERKKLGQQLTDSEFEWICAGYSAGRIPDYQVAAWLMAVRLQGLSAEETDALTRALVATGRTLEWPDERPTVDKHSTGGVGDKTSIVLVPLLASAGLTFVKMSGRGLGFTGGTLDKLESISGFRVNLTLDEIRRQGERIGAAMVGQSTELVPGDGALYALRDVTSTMDSRALIASSVMSKKIAAGARAIILDVKFGTGALMATEAEAHELAGELVRIGVAAGRRVEAVLSRNDEPLGHAVGNSLEVREAIETLRGGGPEDLRELILELGSRLMVLSGVTSDPVDARRGLATLLQGGVGLAKLRQIIEAQGGDPGVVDDPDRLPIAPLVRVLEMERAGVVERFDARTVAEAALALGAGRARKEDAIDPATGVRVLVRAGDRLEAGAPVAEIHAGDESAAESAAEILRRGLILS